MCNPLSLTLRFNAINFVDFMHFLFVAFYLPLTRLLVWCVLPTKHVKWEIKKYDNYYKNQLAGRMIISFTKRSQAKLAVIH